MTLMGPKGSKPSVKKQVKVAAKDISTIQEDIVSSTRWPLPSQRKTVLSVLTKSGQHYEKLFQKDLFNALAKLIRETYGIEGKSADPRVSWAMIRFKTKQKLLPQLWESDKPVVAKVITTLAALEAGSGLVV